MVTIATFLADVLFFIKNDLTSNITDPKSSRTGNSAFIMTSFPKRNVIYPLITIKIPNYDAPRSGMQTTAMDLTVQVEVRVWALDEKTKDTLSNAVYDRLRVIQFITSGSVNNGLHDFRQLSANEIDEDGENAIKSRVQVFQYKIFDVN